MSPAVGGVPKGRAADNHASAPPYGCMQHAHGRRRCAIAAAACSVAGCAAVHGCQQLCTASAQAQRCAHRGRLRLHRRRSRTPVAFSHVLLACLATSCVLWRHFGVTVSDKMHTTQKRARQVALQRRCAGRARAQGRPAKVGARHEMVGSGSAHHVFCLCARSSTHWSPAAPAQQASASSGTKERLAGGPFARPVRYRVGGARSDVVFAAHRPLARPPSSQAGVLVGRGARRPLPWRAGSTGAQRRAVPRR
jgi:hypothetical protein